MTQNKSQEVLEEMGEHDPGLVSCDTCGELACNGHLAGCPIGENEEFDMPDIKDVKVVFICPCGSGALEGQCQGEMCNPEANR